MASAFAAPALAAHCCRPAARRRSASCATASGEADTQTSRVFVSRRTREDDAQPSATAPAPSAPPQREFSSRPAPEDAPTADASPAAPREFGRFARDASGNFVRPGGIPLRPEADRPTRPDDGDRPRAGAGGRFGAPAPGRGAPLRGRPGGRGERGSKGKGGEDGPAGGRAATEARRNARASRKEERSSRVEKKERAEFLELPPGGLSVEALASQLAVTSADVIKLLFMKGIVTTVLDKEKVALVAAEYEVEVLEEGEASVEAAARKLTSFTTEEDLEFLQPRAPVVTIMGHVDHGKTSLLDFIRKTRVAAGEAGGITQGIGAYQVTPVIGGVATPITFLDTPGHEAFSAMRARGARVTDIAVIMVAADDGVRPQTLEAIAHAQSAGVPMVVALNKIDKEGANVERVKQELATAGLVPEEWGGVTPVVPISAKRGTGIDSLLETLQLVAEMSELSANPERPARGTVVEAYMDRSRGATATLLVQAGTLRLGDCVSAGPAYGRVRALLSDAGERVPDAGPSTPVQLLGLDCVPAAGDEFEVCASEEEARERAGVARDRLLAERLVEQSTGQEQRVQLGSSLTSGGADSGDEGLKRLNIVLKTDVAGSLEAVKSATSNISQDRVALRFLLSAAGDVSPSDIDLASASGSMILAFNLSVSEDILGRAKERGVDVRSYDVIYALVDDIKLTMESMLKPIIEKVPLGEAVVRGVFGSGLSGKVAGVMITTGKLVAKCMICVKRGKEVVFEGRIESLRRMKDVVKEVGEGFECGVGSTFPGWKEGDLLEAYDLQTRRVVLPLKSDMVKAAV